MFDVGNSFGGECGDCLDACNKIVKHSLFVGGYQGESIQARGKLSFKGWSGGAEGTTNKV